MSDSNGGAASAAPLTPEDAEQLLRDAITPEEAWRIYEIAGEREEGWRAVKLRAEWTYGKLLGPAKLDHSRKPLGDKLSPSEKKVRQRARRVFEVPEAKLDAYIASTDRPTREGLLREYGPPREAKGREAGDETVTANSRSVAHHWQVLNWVHRQMRHGLTSKEIVSLSHTAHDWPVEGKPLSDGSLVSCSAAIYHLEEQGVRFPIKSRGLGKTEESRRQYHLRQFAAAEKRAGNVGYFRSTQFELMRSVSYLETIGGDLDYLRLDESEHLIDELYADLLRLEIFRDNVLGKVRRKLGEAGERATIAKLRAMTVANGCTIEEESLAQQMADLAESKLTRKLAEARP